jgi:hypothetical protein
MNNYEKILDVIKDNPKLYAEFRINVELENFTYRELSNNLKTELQYWKLNPELLTIYYPTEDHFLDYILALNKLLVKRRFKSIL